jgi:hypothetical protein
MEMSIDVLLRLLLAHILSDFVLQTDGINNGRKGYAKDGESEISTFSKYGFQVFHSLTHALVSYLLVAQWDNWMIPLVILVSHFIMDYVKSGYMKETVFSFVLDQMVHLAVILLLWLVMFQNDVVCTWLESSWASTRLWAIIIAYVLVLKPTSIFLNLFIKRWAPTESLSQSLPNAGKWIGYLERILILTFILTGNLEGVGFLLAAKSVFRFGDLSKASEIKTTEYVLIGTLSSFTIAILVGVALFSGLS